MADTPIGPKAAKVTRNAVFTGVDIDVTGLSQRLLAEAMRLLSDLSQQGYDGDDLADRVSSGLMNLSDRPIQDAARGASAESFNLGRNLGAQKDAAAITSVIRTEFLDANTCPPCREFDGVIVDMNSDEYFRIMPPNGCDGRDLCRGFYMFLTGDEANA